ncbi:hypothetical protein [Nonlabens ulvanivorans]|nr:hypothetical protein [Nonlabens ulvanivorans]
MTKAPDVFIKNGKKYYTTLNAYGANANPQYYFTKALEQAPDWWSAENKARINAGQMPHPDETFLKKLGRNLNEADFAKLKAVAYETKTSRALMSMEHHHLNHLDEAIGLPWKVHRGAGNTKFWHKFGKGSKRVLGTALVVVGMAMSLEAYAVNGDDPITAEFGITGVDIEDENINLFMEVLGSQKLETAIETLSEFDQFSIYYASLSETKDFIENGTIPGGAGKTHSSAAYTAQERHYYNGEISPYMFIFYNDNLLDVRQTPQNTQTDPDPESSR